MTAVWHFMTRTRHPGFLDLPGTRHSALTGDTLAEALTTICPMTYQLLPNDDGKIQAEVLALQETDPVVYAMYFGPDVPEVTANETALADVSAAQKRLADAALRFAAAYAAGTEEETEAMLDAQEALLEAVDYIDEMTRVWFELPDSSED